MQFFAAVLAAAAVGATPVAPPEIAYNVCSFQAGCVPHSAHCKVAFNVWRHGTFETSPGVECEALSKSRLDGSMENIYNGRCKLSPHTFNLTFCARGATLRVTGPVSIATNLTGSTLLPISEWKLKNNNYANILTYVGPKEMELPVV